MDCSLPDSLAHRILQGIILEWVAIPFPRASSQPRDWTQVSCIAGRFCTVWATREAPNQSQCDPDETPTKHQCYNCTSSLPLHDFTWSSKKVIFCPYQWKYRCTGRHYCVVSPGNREIISFLIWQKFAMLWCSCQEGVVKVQEQLHLYQAKRRQKVVVRSRVVDICSTTPFLLQRKLVRSWVTASTLQQ